jgi:hypothetical protein
VTEQWFVYWPWVTALNARDLVWYCRVVYINMLFGLNLSKILFAYGYVLCVYHALSIPLHLISFPLHICFNYFQVYLILPFHWINVGLFVAFPIFFFLYLSLYFLFIFHSLCSSLCFSLIIFPPWITFFQIYLRLFLDRHPYYCASHFQCFPILLQTSLNLLALEFYI